MNVCQVIQHLIDCEVFLGFIEQEDEIYVRNQIMQLLNISDFVLGDSVQSDDKVPNLLEQLVDYSCENGIIKNVSGDRKILEIKIMDCLMSKPSVINKDFYEKFNYNSKSNIEAF
ncbi:hypothetical protein CPJCM30710_07190 [Clostridium polyendosporum]|uniref:Uncharacterized protein n=1 Tax=Clostridium polyendosporum TaxID=69208 RepID=A0A919VKY8_9CLOT|nr:hypothetical protein [Clostridium polyendosporum]GIM28053.1 hypothetical protein CPJCM30710_07190 [Clostridium polyendosporum]